MKRCNICGENKSFSEMVVKKDCLDGFQPLCKLCKNEKQRKYRKDNKNSSTRKYEKTPSGYIMRTYRNMLSRVKGILKTKIHLYKGKEIIPKEEFYEWSIANGDFLDLLENYKNSEYDMRFAPSIDRIDPAFGYIKGNIRWICHWKNSQLGAVSRHNKEK